MRRGRGDGNGMNRALIKFSEFRPSKENLDGLSEDLRAALAVFCFALNEINSLMRLNQFSEQSLDEKPEIVSAIVIQRTALMRTISSKLFELREFLSIHGKYSKTNDADLQAFKTFAHSMMKTLEDHEGFKFVKKIRNEATNHYSLKAARSRLAWVHDEAQRTLYSHENPRNSFYPYGEEVLFIGLINELIRSTEDQSAAAELILKMADWNIAATRVFNELFNEFLDRYVLGAEPKRRSKVVCYWVNPDLVGTASGRIIPVFSGNG